MEKYAVVREKLKKLIAEQTNGDSYDPFPQAQKAHKNGQSRQPQNVAPYSHADSHGEQLAINVDPTDHYSQQQDYLQQQGSEFPVAKAIGNLQYRSHSEGQDAEVSDEYAADSMLDDQPFVTKPTAYEDDLIAQEIHRLEMRALDINNRSQQQADDILDLKRAAQQAAIAFGRQGIHDHPQLAVINRFFDRYAASHVPIIERDDCGHFTLIDHTINLRRAEEEAIENAAVLRGHRHAELMPARQPFAQPLKEKAVSKKAIAAGQTRPVKNSPVKNKGSRVNLRSPLSRILRVFRTLWKTSLENVSLRSTQAEALSKPPSQSLAAEHYIENYSEGQPFSIVDGAIWFSGAAIVARLALKTIVSLFPVFQPLLWLAPLGFFCAAVYLLFVAKSSNSTLIYRLALIALGLFLSGSL